MSDVLLLELINKTVKDTIKMVLSEELDLRNDPIAAKYMVAIKGAKDDEELYRVINDITMACYDEGVNFGLHMAQKVIRDYAKNKQGK